MRIPILYIRTQHDMGKKMSIYDNLFKEFVLETVQMDISDNTISFVVDIAPSPDKDQPP